MEYHLYSGNLSSSRMDMEEPAWCIDHGDPRLTLLVLADLFSRCVRRILDTETLCALWIQRYHTCVFIKEPNEPRAPHLGMIATTCA